MIAQIILTLLGIIMSVIALVIYLVINKAEKSLKIEPNSVMVEIDTSRKRFTQGHTKGLLVKLKLKRNGCYYIEFYPTDVEQGETVEKAVLQRLIVGKEYLKPMARGEDSDHRQILKTISRNPADIPKALRGTYEGNELAKLGQEAFIERSFSEAIPEGDAQVKEIMMKSYRGLGKNFVKHVEDLSNLNKENFNQNQTQPKTEN
jgi:hypothetical protein